QRGGGLSTSSIRARNCRRYLTPRSPEFIFANHTAFANAPPTRIPLRDFVGGASRGCAGPGLRGRLLVWVPRNSLFIPVLYERFSHAPTRLGALIPSPDSIGPTPSASPSAPCGPRTTRTRRAGD